MNTLRYLLALLPGPGSLAEELDAITTVVMRSWLSCWTAAQSKVEGQVNRKADYHQVTFNPGKLPVGT